MLLHVTFGAEALATALSARERLLVCVDPHVDLEVGYQGEFLATALESAHKSASWSASYVSPLPCRLSLRRGLIIVTFGFTARLKSSRICNVYLVLKAALDLALFLSTTAN